MYARFFDLKNLAYRFEKATVFEKVSFYKLDFSKDKSFDCTESAVMIKEHDNDDAVCLYPISLLALPIPRYFG